MRNARAHKLQWSGPTAHSSTVTMQRPIQTLYGENFLTERFMIDHACPFILINFPFEGIISPSGTIRHGMCQNVSESMHESLEVSCILRSPPY